MRLPLLRSLLFELFLTLRSIKSLVQRLSGKPPIQLHFQVCQYNECSQHRGQIIPKGFHPINSQRIIPSGENLRESSSLPCRPKHSDKSVCSRKHADTTCECPRPMARTERRSLIGELPGISPFCGKVILTPDGFSAVVLGGTMPPEVGCDSHPDAITREFHEESICFCNKRCHRLRRH